MAGTIQPVMLEFDLPQLYAGGRFRIGAPRMVRQLWEILYPNDLTSKVQ